MKHSIVIAVTFLALVLSVGCFRMRTSKGGGEIKTIPTRGVNPDDIAVFPGYKIEPVAQGLSFPTAVAFDDKGILHVIEAGYSYGEVWTEPKLIRIENNGTQNTIATGAKNGP